MQPVSEGLLLRYSLSFSTLESRSLSTTSAGYARLGRVGSGRVSVVEEGLTEDDVAGTWVDCELVAAADLEVGTPVGCEVIESVICELGEPVDCELVVQVDCELGAPVDGEVVMPVDSELGGLMDCELFRHVDDEVTPPVE